MKAYGVKYGRMCRCCLGESICLPSRLGKKRASTSDKIVKRKGRKIARQQGKKDSHYQGE